MNVFIRCGTSVLLIVYSATCIYRTLHGNVFDEYTDLNERVVGRPLHPSSGYRLAVLIEDKLQLDEVEYYPPGTQEYTFVHCS